MKTTVLFSLGVFLLMGFVSGNDHPYIVETLAKITVHSGEYERFDTPLTFSMDAITHVYEGVQF